jgi:hypothetical protein
MVSEFAQTGVIKTPNPLRLSKCLAFDYKKTLSQCQPISQQDESLSSFQSIA